MREGNIIVKAQPLKDFATRIFSACNISSENALKWADVLVWANLRGVDSHGVLRIPRYIETIKNGNINARPNITIEKKDAAIAVLDWDASPFTIWMARAM